MRRQQSRQKGTWKKVGLDVVLTAVALCIFALFHHVLPRAATTQPLAVIPVQSTTIQLNTTEDDGDASSGAEAANVVTTAADQGFLLSASAGGKTGRGGQSVSSGKGGSALTDVDTTEAEASKETETVDTTAIFTDEVQETESSYSSSGLSVTVTTETSGGVTYHIADIYLTDITSLQTVLAGDTYGTGYRESLLSMTGDAGALVAINGDYYGNTQEGVVIRNGVVYRANPTDCDVCVLYQDGTMRTMAGPSFSLEEAIADGAWQAWTFGPALLDVGGNAITQFSATSHILTANPRSAIGYYSPGHYCLVVVDGRGQNESDGMSLTELSQLFESLGCKAAYNLDGGNSSIMVWQDEIYNEPSGGGRETSDCILIKEAS